MYGNANVEDYEEESPVLRSISVFWMTDRFIVAPYDVTILMIGCISMMGGLCLTIFTLVMGMREEGEEDINFYNSIMWGPALMGLGCLMFITAAALCGLEVQKNSRKQKVGFMKMEEDDVEKVRGDVGFVSKKGRSGGLAVVY